MTFLPLSHLKVQHNYSGDKWQTFTGDLSSAQVTLREFDGLHTARLSFYNATMDPSQSSGTRVIKKGDKVKIHAHKGDGSTWRKMATLKVKKVSVDIDLTKPSGRQNKVTVDLIGNGFAGVGGTGGSSGVATVPELSNTITGAPYEINGETNVYAWTGTPGASTSTETTPSATVRTNLATNPSFEYGTTGWSTNRCTITADDEWAVRGIQSLKIVADGTGSNSYAQLSAGTLTVGQTYTVSATVRLSAALTGTLNTNALKIVAQNGDATQTYTSSAATNAAGQTRLSVTFTPAAGNNSYVVRLYNGSITTGEAVWWDDLLIEQAGSAGTFFNGDSAGYTGSVTTPTGSWTEVAYVDTASDLDQILLTRDSNPGTVVYEDPDGTIQMFDSATARLKPPIDGGGGMAAGTPSHYIGPSDYSSIDQQFDMSHIINVVQFKYLEKIKSGSHPTRVKEHDITFTDSASVAKYGRFKKKIKTHKKSDFAAHASAIFARNADPQQVPASVTIPMIAASDLLPGYEDGHYVGHRVGVILPDGVTTYTCRISKIVHNVSPTRWTVTVYLRAQDLMQRPRPADVGMNTEVANTPDGTVLTAHLDDQAVTTAKVADNAVTTVKIPNAAVTYAKLASDVTGPITTAQTTADGKNKVTYSTSTPGTTANTAGDIWFQFSGSIIIGQWKGNGGTSWTSMTLDNAVIANLDAGKITAGTIAAARIAAQSITADKLLIGLQQNYIVNPGAEQGITAPHTGTTLTVATGSPRTGTGAFKVVITGSGTCFTANGTNTMPTPVGSVVRGEMYVKVTGTAVGTPVGTPQITAYDSTGAVVSTTSGTGVTLNNTGYQLLSVDYTVPAGVASVGLSLSISGGTGSFLIDDLFLGTKVTGSLIVDGSITASKISAGAIDGMTITGPVIQTAASGSRMTIQNDTSAGVIKFYSGVSGETGGYINPGVDANGAPNLWVAPSSNVTWANLPQVLVTTGKDATFKPSVRVVGHANTFFGVGSPVAFSVDMSGNIIGTTLSASGNITSSAGAVSAATDIISITPTTTTSAANVNWNSANGKFRNVTSLSKHKVEQEPLSAEAVRGVLSLTPKTWFDRAEVEENGGTDGLRRIPGLIAEDVEEHAPELALYDADGHLQGVAYDRVAALLIPIIREQQEQIATLTKRIGALERAALGDR